VPEELDKPEPDETSKPVPAENEAPGDKGKEEIEEYGSRTDDDESTGASPESRRSLASRPGGTTRVPNFLPANPKDHDNDEDPSPGT
jgi:hypothetical protein